MNRLTRRTRVAVVAIVMSIGLWIAHAGFADTTYSDPAGDSRGAPDITQFAVSNDSAGTLTFRLTTVGPLVNGSVAAVDLDTDSNPTTGSYGAEYSIMVGLGGFALEKWDGARWGKVASASLTSAVSGNVIETRISRQEIGVGEMLGVSAWTALYDASDALTGDDDAPDAGEWVYVLTFPQCSNGKDDDADGKADGQDLGCSAPTDDLESDDPVTLKPGRATMKPGIAKVGKPVVVSAPVTRVETGLGIPAGTARCVVRIGTKRINVAGKVVPGRASCRFTIPATKAKIIRGTITVTVVGHTVTIPFSFRVA